MTIVADEKYVRSLGEWDWWVLPEGDRLHAGEIEFDDTYVTMGRGKTECGVQSTLAIPGIFSRMGLERCAHCCRNVGYPRGIGSPKNDPSCRPLVVARGATLGLALVV